MKAAILAAGLGTRLRPLTYQFPKALIPVMNRPLLGVLLAQLRAAGATQVAVNTHHQAEKVEVFLHTQGPWGFDLHISHEPEILGTGGGVRDLGKLLGEEPFLAINADILTDVDLAAIYRLHQEGALATLVLHHCPPYNKVWIDETGAVVGIGSPPNRKFRPPLAYTGIQVVSPKMLKRLPPAGFSDLIPAWREAIAAGERVATVLVTGHFWQDVGTPAAYLEAHRRVLAGASPPLTNLFLPFSDPLVGSGSVLEEGLVCGGGVCLGRHVFVGARAYLANTVVWDQAWIGPGVKLLDCIVASGVKVTASAQGQVIV